MDLKEAIAECKKVLAEAPAIHRREALEIVLNALSAPAVDVVELLVAADELYKAAEVLDGYCTMADGFEGDIPDEVWVPLQKALQVYEKSRRLTAQKEG